LALGRGKGLDSVYDGGPEVIDGSGGDFAVAGIVGTSLIAANISAEQIIGMSGSGYAIVVSLMQKPTPETVTVDVTNIDYSTSTSFKIASAVVIAILIVLYTTWW
jgi:hypothetical protein